MRECVSELLFIVPEHFCLNEPRHEKNLSSGFLTRFDTNQAVHLQKMARDLKFRIYEVEGLYYLCSKKKGAAQLQGYHAADLRLCF